MPYTEGPIDKSLEPFLKALCKLPADQISGEINRMICRTYLRLEREKIVGRYLSWSWFRGTVNDSVDEIRRRCIADYEDLKAQKNGDIFEDNGGTEN